VSNNLFLPFYYHLSSTTLFIRGVVFVHMGNNSFPGQFRGFLDGQILKAGIRDFIQHFDTHVVTAMKINAVLGNPFEMEEKAEGNQDVQL
jgi:hypothetical protein